jgi:hypothetical protein
MLAVPDGYPDADQPALHADDIDGAGHRHHLVGSDN